MQRTGGVNIKHSIENGKKMKYKLQGRKLQMLEKMLKRSFPESLKNEMDDLDHYTNAYSVFYKELETYWELLENPNTINWGQIFQIQGLQDGICEIFRTVALSKLVDVKTSSFQIVIHPDPDLLPDVKLQVDPKLTLAHLDVPPAGQLSKTESQGGNPRCQNYLADLICCFPSACVLDEHGNPLSWSLTDQFATVIHNYILPEHRGKGPAGLWLLL
ncbi:glycine N-acyltransferase-like protein 3 [Empidonax traillii]|uniref:glycine N-acyltransferase-like protein 3 n=1 Tax=Empidonax traillii TaxID=164674 RepID=UPI000FFD743B|nr:glycine N-acyltransferase-like protein 3 [Empidonax traillii]